MQEKALGDSLESARVWKSTLGKMVSNHYCVPQAVAFGQFAKRIPLESDVWSLPAGGGCNGCRQGRASDGGRASAIFRAPHGEVRRPHLVQF